MIKCLSFLNALFRLTLVVKLSSLKQDLYNSYGMVLILWHSQYSSKMLRSVLFLSGCFKKLRDMFWYSSFISAILLLEMHLTLFDCTYNNLREAKEIVNTCWPSAKHYSFTSIQGSRVGAVVRVLAFHQCVPGSIPALGVISGMSLLVL